MPLNWTTGALMRPAGCLPCCDGPAEACNFTLPFPPGSEYPDEAAAIAAIADNTADCLIFYNPQNGPGQTQGAVSASVAGGVLSVSNEAGTPALSPVSPNALTRVYLTAADDVSIAYSITSTASADLDVSVALLADDGTTVIDSDTDSAASSTTLSGTFNFTVPSDGYYYIQMTGGGAFVAAPFDLTAEFDVDGGASAEFCLIRAAWDDSGTTAYVICT